MDQSRNRRIASLLERIEVQFRVVGDVRGGNWNELFANGVVEGVLPVNQTQNVWCHPIGRTRRKEKGKGKWKEKAKVEAKERKKRRTDENFDNIGSSFPLAAAAPLTLSFSLFFPLSSQACILNVRLCLDHTSQTLARASSPSPHHL